MRSLKKLGTMAGIIMLLLFIPSCVGDYFDINKLSMDNEVTVSLSAPLINGEITLGDYISDLEFITTDTINGYALLKVVFENDSIGGFSPDDIIDVNVQQNITYAVGEVNIPNISNINSEITFQDVVDNVPDLSYLSAADGQTIQPLLPGGYSIPVFGPVILPNDYPSDPIDQFQEVTFSEGRFSITFENQMPMPVDIAMDLYTRINNQDVKLQSFSFSLSATGDIQTESLDLAGRTVGSLMWWENAEISSPGSTEEEFIDLVNQKIIMNTEASDLVVQSGVVKFEDQHFNNQEEVIQLGMGEDMEINTMQLNSGGFSLNVTNPFDFQISIDLRLPNVKNENQEMLTKQIVLAPNQTTPTFIDFTNTTTTFNQGASGSEMSIEYDIHITSGGNMVNFNTGDELTMGVDFAFSLDQIDYITGYFGQETIDLGSEEMDLGLSDLDFITGNFTLTDPKITLRVESPIGLPVAIEMDIVGEKDGEAPISLGLGQNSGGILSINPPTNPGEIEITEIVIDKNTSNIVDFVSYLPSTINYSGSVYLNKDGNTGVPNFISNNLSTKMGLKVEMPISIQSSNFGFRDTIEMSGIELPEDLSFDQFELYANLKNGFPFQFNITLVFLDSLNNELFNLSPIDPDTGNAVAINSPDVDQSTGRVIESSIEEQTVKFMLNQSVFDQLPSVKNVIIEASISTPNGGADEASIYTDYALAFALFLQNVEVTVGF